MSIDLNDTFLIHNIAIKNRYEHDKLQKKWAIGDIKSIFVFTYNLYLFYFKTQINNVIAMQTIFDKDFFKILKNIIVGFDDRSIINMMAIFESGSDTTAVKNLFLVHDVSFYSRDPNILNLFQQYHLESNCTLNMSITQPFLDHIFNNICDHNLKLYSYIVNRILYLIQKSGSEIETTFIIIWEQETGKNKFFIDAISNLFGRYVISNENNISNIIDRFNGSIDNKILIVRNELQSIENIKYVNPNYLKSLITDRFCTIEFKIFQHRKYR
jgi:hypothetical protein